jgi:NADH-quinone oxidoreductase subunit J
MTNKPQLRLGESLLPGVLAVALFGVMALITLNTGFADEMVGFPEGISVTSEIGYALFDFTALQSTEGNVGATEQFLAAFLLIAIVLDAALDASLVLAKRETEGETVAALSSVTTGSPGATGSDQVAAADGGSLESRSSESTTSTETDDDEPETGGEE